MFLMRDCNLQRYVCKTVIDSGSSCFLQAVTFYFVCGLFYTIILINTCGNIMHPVQMRYQGYKQHYWLRNFYTLRHHIISCQYLIDNLSLSGAVDMAIGIGFHRLRIFFPNALNLNEYKYMYVGSVQNSLLREPTDSLRLRQLASLKALIIRKEGRKEGSKH